MDRKAGNRDRSVTGSRKINVTENRPVFRQETWKTKSSSRITAEEIRKLIQKSLVAGNGEVTDNTAAGFERQIQDMLSCLSEKVQGKEKEAKQKQDLEKLIIEREKTLKELGRVINEAAQDIVRLETERKNKAQKVDELNEEIGEGGKESLEQEIKHRGSCMKS